MIQFDLWPMNLHYYQHVSPRGCCRENRQAHLGCSDGQAEAAEPRFTDVGLMGNRLLPSGSARHQNSVITAALSSLQPLYTMDETCLAVQK